MRGHQKILVHWGIRNKILKANGGAKDKKDRPKRAINLSQQLPWVYMEFYAEQISVSVKSACPIAWELEKTELNFPLLF